MDQSGATYRADLVVTVRGERLTAACAQRGWSYAELARQAHVSQPTIMAALHGHTIRPMTAWKIARALSLEEAPKVLTDLVGPAAA